MKKKIRLGAFLLLGLSCLNPSFAVSHLNQNASKAGSFLRVIQPRVKPMLTGFGSNSCVVMGQSITVLGSNFGSQKTLALVIGSTYKPLKITFWKNAKIVAYLPSKGLNANTRYPIAIKDKKSKQWLSNTNKSLLMCGLAPKSSPLSKPITPAQNGGKTTTPTPSSPPLGGNINVPQATSAFMPKVSGSLMGRQLPAIPPKLSANQKTSDDDNTLSEPNELVVSSANMSDAQQLDQQLRAYGIRPKKRQKLKNLGLVMTTYRVPAGIDIEQTAASIRQAFPDMSADLNHRFMLQGSSRSTQEAKQLINWGKQQEQCGINARIGLVDTGVNVDHPALRSQAISVHSVLSRGVKKAKQAHGTAIATLLVGQQNSEAFSGLLPSAQLFSVAVFRQKNKRQIDTTAELIVSGVEWLLSQKVDVINMSVGGPRNALVNIAMQRTLQLGVPIVAAAGNGGSKAMPVYPAAQQGVIAVTAVDGDLELYAKANIGSYIDFAAPGVDVWVGTEKGTGKYVTGSSFAVPFVVATMAILSKENAQIESYELLKKTAKDLGEQGKDTQFGWGLLGRLNGCAF